MLGLVGFIKKKLDMEGKLPDKWKDDHRIVLSLPAATVSEEGVLMSSEPMTVTDDGVLIIGDIIL